MRSGRRGRFNAALTPGDLVWRAPSSRARVPDDRARVSGYGPQEAPEIKKVASSATLCLWKVRDREGIVRGGDKIPGGDEIWIPGGPRRGGDPFFDRGRRSPPATAGQIFDEIRSRQWDGTRDSRVALSPPKRTGEGERSGAGLDGLTLPKSGPAEEWARVAREVEGDWPVGRDTLFQ